MHTLILLIVVVMPLHIMSCATRMATCSIHLHKPLAQLARSWSLLESNLWATMLLATSVMATGFPTCPVRASSPSQSSPHDSIATRALRVLGTWAIKPLALVHPPS